MKSNGNEGGGLRNRLRKTLQTAADWLSEPAEWFDSSVEGEPSIEVRCPYCKREAGQPCRRSLPGKRPHLERRLDALDTRNSRK
jgi:hypothetical protein